MAGIMANSPLTRSRDEETGAGVADGAEQLGLNPFEWGLIGYDRSADRFLHFKWSPSPPLNSGKE